MTAVDELIRDFVVPMPVGRAMAATIKASSLDGRVTVNERWSGDMQVEIVRGPGAVAFDCWSTGEQTLWRYFLSIAGWEDIDLSTVVSYFAGGPLAAPVANVFLQALVGR